MSAAQSIIDELQDVETAFEKLSAREVYDIDNGRFRKAQDLLRFQARKQQYKKLRDDAWRWLKNHGRTPTKRHNHERGFYGGGSYFDDEASDNPSSWAVQAYLVRIELGAARQALQHNLPLSSAAPNAQANPYTIVNREVISCI